jgi:hypothetical protein
MNQNACLLILILDAFPYLSNKETNFIPILFMRLPYLSG